MKRYVIATVAFAALATLVRASTASGELRRAEDLFKHADYDRSKQELTRSAATLDAKSLDEALLLRARLETNFGAAESLYVRVMASNDRRISERGRLDLAAMRYASGNYRGALDLLTVDLAPGPGGDSEALFFAALCHRQLGDNARAAAEFKRVTEGPYATWSALARADIDAQEERLTDAVGHYEDILKSRPNPVALFKLGECYETLGDRDKALDRYRSLVSRFPLSLDAAKGREKIQLLSQAPAKRSDEKAAGGGESGGPRTAETAGGTPGRGFTIQFGSFGARANALAVSAKLEKILRGVRVESVEVDGRIYNRVRAGFYETKEAADKDLARAREKSGLTGEVVPLK